MSHSSFLLAKTKVLTFFPSLVKNCAPPESSPNRVQKRAGPPSSGVSPSPCGGGWSATRSRKSGYKRVGIRAQAGPTCNGPRTRYRGSWLHWARFSTAESSGRHSGCTAEAAGSNRPPPPVSLASSEASPPRSQTLRGLAWCCK